MKYEDVQGRLDRAKEYLHKAYLYINAAEIMMLEKGHRYDDEMRLLRMRSARTDIVEITAEVDDLIGALGK